MDSTFDDLIFVVNDYFNFQQNDLPYKPFNYIKYIYNNDDIRFVNVSLILDDDLLSFYLIKLKEIIKQTTDFVKKIEYYKLYNKYDKSIEMEYNINKKYNIITTEIDFLNYLYKNNKKHYKQYCFLSYNPIIKLYLGSYYMMKKKYDYMKLCYLESYNLGSNYGLIYLSRYYRDVENDYDMMNHYLSKVYYDNYIDVIYEYGIYYKKINKIDKMMKCFKKASDNGHEISKYLFDFYNCIYT